MIGPEGRAEGERLHALVNELEQLRFDAARLRARVQELEDLADTDTLAPIYNRRAFVRELSRIMAFAARYDVEAALIYFDLNRFKEINDTYGHRAGDALLREVGRRLLDNVRESDIVGRMGGDEFAVALASAGRESAFNKAADLAEILRETPVRADGLSLEISASYGVYAFQPSDDPETAITRADAAMFKAKRADRPSARGVHPAVRGRRRLFGAV